MLELLNGCPKCTLIERMDGSAKLIGPLLCDKPREVLEFENLNACKDEIHKRGWEVNAAFVRKITGSQD